jgi:hypothetical protein
MAGLIGASCLGTLNASGSMMGARPRIVTRKQLKKDENFRKLCPEGSEP